MKTLSTITVLLLLQSSSPFLANIRRKLQKKLISHF